MIQVDLAFMGPFTVAVDGEPLLNFPSDKVRALLAYLALQPGRAHSRKELTSLLWPEAPHARALHSMRVALHRLRQTLDAAGVSEQLLTVTRQTLQFNASGATVDVARFQALLDASAAHVHDSLDSCPACLAQLDQAVALYRGELLAGFGLADAPAFEEWLLLHREMLQHRALLALKGLADAYEAQGAYARAQAYASRHLELDSYREESHRQLMRILALRGMPDQALAQYASCRRLLREELGVEPDEETTDLVQRISRGDFNPAPDPVAHPAAPSPSPRIDWHEAPLVGAFLGRSAESEQMRRWLTQDRCQVVVLLGMGGVGKSTLAAHTARILSGDFDVVLWRSLLNGPPLDELLTQILQDLAESPLLDPPDSLDGSLSMLLDRLRQWRCLLVLDNVETILEREEAGSLRSGYEAYGQLFKTLGAHRHRSCLLLTSREQPLSLARLERESTRVRSLQLAGLDVETGQGVLREHGLEAPAAAGAALIQRYSGNPLALNLVAQVIQDFYQGDIDNFLADEAPIFDDIRDVLDQQIGRLSPLEHDVLIWLAIARRALTLPNLQANLIGTVGSGKLLQALRSLQHRSLLERSGQGFTQQNVITEHLTERFVEQVSREIESGQVDLLNRFALLHARAQDYIRLSQTRVILAPIADRLTAVMGRDAVVATCRRLLDDLRDAGPRRPGYAAGNILNLLLHMGIDVAGYDFSRLSVWEAHLQGHRLPAVDFEQADLDRSVFTESFGFIGVVAYSPDGQYLFSGSSAGNIQVWQAETGQLLASWRAHVGSVYAIAFSPDGRMLASSGADGAVTLWDSSAEFLLGRGDESGTGLSTGRILGVLRGHAAAVKQVVFSPAAATYTDETSPKRVKNLREAPSDAQMTGQFQATSRRLDYSDDWILASVSDDLTIRLWRVQTGETVHILRGHDSFILTAAFSPDGRLLATGSRAQTDNAQGVRLWDVETGRELCSLAHVAWVNSVAFSPNGQLLATGSQDGLVRLWEVDAVLQKNADSAVSPTTLSGDGDSVQSVLFSPDGRTLASGGDDRMVRLWDIATKLPRLILSGHTGSVRSLAYSPDGQNLVSGGWDRTVRQWDSRTGQALRTLRGGAVRVFGIAFSPDGKRLASASSDGVVHLWDASASLSSGQVINSFGGHTDWAWRVAFSPDGETLASTSVDQTVRLWDVRTGRLRHVLKAHEAGVQAVAFSPDGRLLASCDLDGKLLLTDLAVIQGDEPGLAHVEMEGHAGWCLSVAFSPDGQLLASSGADHLIILQDVGRRSVHRILRGHSNGVQEIAFSPDGSLLASASWDSTVRLWDVETGQVRYLFEGHADIAQGVSFSPDGRTLASSSYDGTVRLWDVATGQALRVLTGHANWVHTVAFSPDGSLLASCGGDETIKLWDPDTGTCLQTWRTPGPYEGMNIAGITGVTEAQKAALTALGAVARS